MFVADKISMKLYLSTKEQLCGQLLLGVLNSQKSYLRPESTRLLFD
jgi:hypothetical protein